MTQKKRERVIESFVLPGMGAEEETKAIVGKAALEAAGFDPELYLAVIPAQCAVGGVATANRQVYHPTELSAEHARLSAKAKTGFVAGEAGHPEGGPTWNVAVRFLGGSSRTLESGAVITEGRFGILNTEAGRNIFCCRQAGMPVGVSLRGWATKEAHLLDDKSPFLALNSALKGETIVVRGELELEAYDIVPLPACGTYLSPTGEAREAFDKLMHDLQPAAAQHGQEEAKMADKPTPDATAAGAPKIETAEQLMAAHKPLVEKIVADALKAAEGTNPLASLDPAQMEVVATIVEAIKGKKGPKVLQEAATEAVAVVRGRVAALEAENEDARKTLETANKRLATLEAENKAVKMRRTIVEALDAKVKAAPTLESVRTFVLKSVDGGKVESTEEAVKLFDDLVPLTQGAALPKVGDTAASAGGAGTAATPAAASATEGLKPAPGLLGKSPMERLTQAMKDKPVIPA